MVQKFFKYLFLLFLLFVIGYNSIYFKKLDEVNAASVSKKFDAKNYAAGYFQKLLPVLQQSVDINSLHGLLHSDPSKAFDTYSHGLGIGNIKYFLTQGKGKVISIEESSMLLMVNDSSNLNIRIATEFVYGNAIRDAGGIINLKDFTSTSDLNDVSAEINKKIRNEVLPTFLKQVKTGDMVAFAGAIELNRQHPDMKQMELVPVTINGIY
ncbi:MAG: DUF2291 domain-containing protein [Bacteroidota bacterium]